MTAESILKRILDFPAGADVYLSSEEIRIVERMFVLGEYYGGRRILPLPPAAPPKTGRWRVGGSIPINVYDENGRPVCQCHTVEDAALIVEAMNFARAHFEGKL